MHVQATFGPLSHNPNDSEHRIDTPPLMPVRTDATHNPNDSEHRIDTHIIAGCQVEKSTPHNPNDSEHRIDTHTVNA